MSTAILSYGSGGSYFDVATGAVKQVSLYFYKQGTLDPITVYTTSALATPHPIPVITTGSGRVPPVWLGTEANPGYRIRAFDQWSTLVEDVDHIPGPAFWTGEDEGGGGGTIEPGDPRLLATGDLIFAFSNAQPREGFVLCNGLPIAKADSTYITEGTVNDNTEALFKYLWGQDIHGALEVIPSRGTTADGDWGAGKGIRTPDLMGRGLVGMDAMGTTGKNRLAGVPLDQIGTPPVAGNDDWLGQTGGEARHTTSEAELPAHNHTLTDPKHNHANAKAAVHTHPSWSGSTGTESAAHVHSGTTGVESANHTHNVPQGGGGLGVPAGTAVGTAATQSSQTTTSDSTNHTHNFTTGTESSNHSHALTVSIAQNTTPQVVTMDDAATGITIAPVGGGQPHNNTPLFLTCAVYIKL